MRLSGIHMISGHTFFSFFMSENNSFSCRWTNCKKLFKTAKELYDHLSNEHIGRRSTNNLCLTCHWNNCNVVAAKRDHLASHIKVHLNLKRKKSDSNHNSFILISCLSLLVLCKKCFKRGWRPKLI